MLEMYFRRFVHRFCNKDNDKIIGMIMKRNYWTPDFGKTTLEQDNSNNNTPFSCSRNDFNNLYMLLQKNQIKIDQMDIKLDKIIAANNENACKTSKKCPCTK